MNETNRLLTKLAEKLDKDGAKEEAEEIKSLVNEEPTEEHKVELDAECPSCGSTIHGVLIEKLVDVADKLDECGAHKEAGQVDEMIKKFAADVAWQKEDTKTQQSHRYDSKHNNEQTFKQPKPSKEKETKHHNPSCQEVGDKILSMRYCPDHQGVMLHRVGEGIYRCELDGKTYNWEAGWTDSSGKHPGGSISGQTEIATNVPIPSRVFDHREDVVNKIN